MISERRQTMKNESSGSNGGAADLLSSLVRSTQRCTTFTGDGTKLNEPNFTDDELLGDIFITMIGGHKTTATTIRFGLLLLAMNIASQRRLQQDIDDILQGLDPKDWSYDEHFKLLFKGMPGAVIAEVLRWLPPILSVPKLATQDQRLTVNGNQCTVPCDTLVAIDVVAAHRNPQQWPNNQRLPSNTTGNSTSDLIQNNDLDEFRPERWISQLTMDQKHANDL